MKFRLLFPLLLLPALLLPGCASKTTEVVLVPEPLEEIREAQPIETTNGSLWTTQSGSLFEDHKARAIGDIVTIVISEQARASREASTTSGRDSNYAAGIPNFFGLENHDFVVESNLDMSNMLNANFTNSFQGSGKTERSGDLTASLSAQIIDVYPNGNYKVRGGKEVMVNTEVQIIYLSGIVRPVDITAGNTIDSNKILNARISYTGRGPIADKQEPGWLGRAIDHVWPF
ncbi:flagellar basal body L-ring protein FlgH [Desulfofustis glycolicus]|uniref:Flagellar L-ring protein n=1 Tax=Desulfofustis glycolicus DSM 9705 TaxID=1121409 RepID=A0A1M5U0J5_9BACT|nr:flagellar basal body L-ring protein FlgH [Desulfofustis glycolicus]MCB2214726.1 flagellar basal body L-ring protein FlgH [Desulfobulbaceae bacterium]SHH56519.1 flagellar L-ring protein precursor FlgH [Desulfofustis glycolicus DSM 9705]